MSTKDNALLNETEQRIAQYEPKLIYPYLFERIHGNDTDRIIKINQLLDEYDNTSRLG